MSTDFNWQTDEEGWGREVVPEERDERPKRRWWIPVLVSVVILGVIGFLMYRQVQRQIEAAVARAETDVRRTHELVLQAAERRDRDLLHSMISSHDDNWLHQQLLLAEEGLLYNPRPFGLVAQTEAVPEYGYEFSADLSEAEVVVTRTFTVQSPTGVSETVALKQQALYRRGQDRWLFAPPLDWEDFWREEDSIEGQYVTITYPKRDAQEVEKLLDYLDGKVTEMCISLPDFECPNDLHLHLDLTVESISLLEMQDVDLQFENTSELTLPTISLVGIPADEATRDALHRAYAVQVVRKAMIQALEWECCPRGLFFRALMDYQLAELNIRAYPIFPVDYEKLFAQFRNIDQLDDFWRLRQIELVDEQTWQWPFAVVEFLLSTTLSDKTAGAMQQRLLSSNTYIEWLDEALAINVVDVTVRQAWLNFIYNSSLSGRVVVGTYEPQQDILLACESISSPRTRLYRYEWDRDEWLDVDEFEATILFMSSTPDDSAVVFQLGNFKGPEGTFLWENGRKTVLVDGTKPEQAGYFFIGNMAPDGRKFLMFNQIQDVLPYSILDIDSCTVDGCQLLAIPGVPRWSPDASQYTLDLFEDFDGFQSIVGVGRVDESGNLLQVSDNGYSSFWLGEEEYGFITYGEEPAIFAANTADDAPNPILNAEVLRSNIAEEERPESIIIFSAVPNPANRNIIAISTFDNGRLRTSFHLFYWNRRSDEITHDETLKSLNIGPITWLPGGEWLVVPTFDERQTIVDGYMPWSYYLFHVSGEEEPIRLFRDSNLSYPAYDHSFDGKWLLIPHSGYLEVIGLDHPAGGNRPYRRLLPHDFTNCRNALFVW